MAGKAKPSARQAFDDNIADAETLVLVASALVNQRSRKMRRELRVKLGESLGLPKKHHDDLDCIESPDVFAIFKPGSRLSRDILDERSLRPLLRQALVAGCAAVETFAGDRVMERLSEALDRDEKPARLLELPMTVGDWIRIEEGYKRRRWGLREIIELEIRRQATSAPSQIGILFATVGEQSLWKRIDSRRNVKRSSEKTLDAIYARRNKIAHQGDRVGTGRATISVDEVRADLDQVTSIVDALDKEV